MKFFLVLFTLATVSLSSCIEGDVITQGATVRTDYIVVRPDQWQSTDVLPGEQGHYLYAEVDYPVISKYMLESGLVIAYYIDAMAGYDNILPYIRPYVDYDYDYLYTETIRFDTQVGRITFIIEASDFMAPYINYNMKFKVVTIANAD